MGVGLGLGATRLPPPLLPPRRASPHRGFVQRVQAVAPVPEHALVPPWVPAQDVAHDGDGFLDDVRRPRADEVEEGRHAAFRGGVDRDGQGAHAAHGFAGKVDVDLGRVLWGMGGGEREEKG